MPVAKPKPSEIAAEAKKTYIPYIKEKWGEKWPPHSFLVSDSYNMRCPPKQNKHRCRIGIIEGDPVDVALDWAKDSRNPGDVPIISMANDKRPGGDWEAGVMAPEECLCRRSNLVATLNTPAQRGHYTSNYPIPPTGAIYSPTVVVFRSGPERYQLWREFVQLPVISVPPVRRPKLDPTGQKYSFEAEKELMKEKIRTALRIAVYYEFEDICLGAWGCGSGFRNPAGEVAAMWRDILFYEDEFDGHFANVVFAFDSPEVSSSSGPIASSSSSTGSSKASSKTAAKAAANRSSAQADMEIFKDVFNPAKMRRSK